MTGLLGGPGTVSILRGPPNVGKSAVAVAFAAHIAEGRPLTGRRIHKGGCLYIGAEASGSIRMRLEAFRARLKDRRPIHLCSLTPDLRSPWDVNEPIGLIASLRGVIRLVVIDTLIRSIADGEENHSGDMNAACAGARRLAEEADVHVILVHHTGHDESRTRGSSALRAAVDTEISLRVDKEQWMRVRLRTPKQRDMTTDIAIGVRLRIRPLEIDADGDPFTTVIAKFEETETGPDLSVGKHSTRVPTEAQWDALAREILCGLPSEGATAPEIARAVSKNHPLRKGRNDTTVARCVRDALKRLVGQCSSGVVVEGKQYRSVVSTGGG